MIKGVFLQEVIWFLKGLIKPRQNLVLISMIMLIKVLFFLSIPFILKIMIDTIIPAKNIHLFFQLLAFLLVMILLLVVAFYLESTHISNIVVKHIQALEKELLILFVQNYDKYKKLEESQLIKLVVSNCSELELGVIHHLWPMLSVFILGVCSLFLLLYMNAFVTIIIAVILISYYMFVSFLGKHLKKYSRESGVFHQRILKYIKECISKKEEIILYNYESTMIKKLEHLSDLNQTSRVLKNKYKRNLSNGGTVITEFMTIIGLILYMPLILYYGHTTGAMIGYLNLLTVLQWAVGSLSYLYPHALTSAVSLGEIERVLCVMKQKNNQRSKNKTAKFDQDFKKISVDIRRLEVEVEVIKENDDSGPKTKQTLVRDIQLEVERNKKIIFMGKSGSGKSTTLNIICGLYSNFEGKVWIGQHNVRGIKESSLYDNISYVPQRSKLFNLSIKENLIFGSKHLSDEEVVSMCKCVGIHQEIMRMEHGYDTVVDVNATNLSGGQVKRLDIARALLKKPKILMLDEPLAPLDAKTQGVVMPLLMGLPNTTVIMVSHNLKFNDLADAVYLFAKGSCLHQ